MILIKLINWLKYKNVYLYFVYIYNYIKNFNKFISIVNPKKNKNIYCKTQKFYLLLFFNINLIFFYFISYVISVSKPIKKSKLIYNLFQNLKLKSKILYNIISKMIVHTYEFDM